MRPDDPPESWLLKAWDGDVLVDLIFEPAGLTIDDELIAGAACANAAAMEFRVMAMDDVLYTKLNALNEHCLDFIALLQIARTVREQVDWDRLRERTAGSPYATAFFCLLDAVLLRTLPVQEPEKLVFVDAVGADGRPNGSPPYPCFERFRDEARSFTGIAAFASDDLDFKIDGRLEQVFGQYVS